MENLRVYAVSIHNSSSDKKLSYEEIMIFSEFSFYVPNFLAALNNEEIDELSYYFLFS